MNTSDWFEAGVPTIWDRIKELEERILELEKQNEQRKLSEWNTSMSGKLDLPIQPYPFQDSPYNLTAQDFIAHDLHRKQQQARWDAQRGPLTGDEIL